MTTSTLDELLDRAPVEAITERAKTIEPKAVALGILRFLLAVAAGSLYGVGWTVWKALAGLWFVIAWMIAAVATGWIEAGGPVRAPKPDTAADR